MGALLPTARVAKRIESANDSAAGSMLPRAELLNTCRFFGSTAHNVLPSKMKLFFALPCFLAS